VMDKPGYRALGKGKLLFLKWKQIVDPFDHEQSFQETKGQSTVVKRSPVDGVKDLDAGPGVMLEEIGPVGRKAA
jgi:hypothetical protein